MLQSFRTRDELAIWRKNRGNAHDVARGNARAAQCQLKAREPLSMFSDTFCQEDLFRNERHVGAGVRFLLEKAPENLREL
jgi:hypothetical protein